MSKKTDLVNINNVAPKKKGGPLNNKKRKDIIQELEKIIINGQSLGVTNVQLAKQFGVQRHTIKKYLDDIYSNIPPEQIQHTQVKMQTMFDKIFREAQRMLSEAKSFDEKRVAGDFMLKCLDKFTDFLERFGIKPKVADNLNINADITNKQLIINYNMPYNEIKNE